MREEAAAIAGEIAELRHDIHREPEIGYDLPATGVYDQATREVVTAFQRHFRPARVDGIVDYSTYETLKRLLAARALVA